MRKTICIALLVSLIFGTNISTIDAKPRVKSRVKPKAPVSAKPKETPSPYQARLLVEADTGQVLYEDNPHKKWPPASMVKMMLALIVMEKLKEGSIQLTAPVTVSQSATRIGGSQVYLKEGEVFTLEELMEAVLIASANDASTAVAEYVAGSVEACVQLMNEQAKALGMNDTQYFNVHGLPAKAGQQDDVTTAYDSVILARELVKYPDVLRWTSTEEARFRNNTLTLTITNHLIGSFPGADGLKTGYIARSRFNLTATAKRGDMRLIAVVLGGVSSHVRFQEAARLLSMGFDTYHKQIVLRKEQPFNQTLSVKKGQSQSMKPIAAEDAVVIIKKGEAQHLSLQPELPEFVEAPVNKGQELGKVSIMLSNHTLVTVPLVAPEDIPRANLLWRLFHYLDVNP